MIWSYCHVRNNVHPTSLRILLHRQVDVSVYCQKEYNHRYAYGCTHTHVICAASHQCLSLIHFSNQMVCNNTFNWPTENDTPEVVIERRSFLTCTGWEWIMVPVYPQPHSRPSRKPCVSQISPRCSHGLCRDFRGHRRSEICIMDTKYALKIGLQLSRNPISITVALNRVMTC